MPQMAPISWLFLFFLFFLSFMMFNIMNYYNYMPSTPLHYFNNKKFHSLNWKW